MCDDLEMVPSPNPSRPLQLQFGREALLPKELNESIASPFVDKQALLFGVDTAVRKAWKVKVDDQGLVVLPKVLSRKKQIIPKLEAAAKEEL